MTRSTQNWRQSDFEDRGKDDDIAVVVIDDDDLDIDR